METLIQAAIAAQKNAHALYSNYPVGAALLASSGKIYQGCCMENASYPLGCCAERNAMAAAVVAGERSFDAICVVTKNGGYPCGGCRQVLHEFAPKLKIIVSNPKGEILSSTTLDTLLPESFGPDSLELA